MPNVCEKCGKCYTPDNDLCADCDLAETTELYEEITQLKAELADARAEAEHWKGESSDLVRMAHEMRAEIDYFQTLIDLQHKRTMEADKLWQVARAEINIIEHDANVLLGDIKAELERKDKLIEQMTDALKWALSEARTTECERMIEAALSAAERGGK